MGEHVLRLPVVSVIHQGTWPVAEWYSNVPLCVDCKSGARAKITLRLFSLVSARSAAKRVQGLLQAEQRPNHMTQSAKWHGCPAT